MSGVTTRQAAELIGMGRSQLSTRASSDAHWGDILVMGGVGTGGTREWPPVEVLVAHMLREVGALVSRPLRGELAELLRRSVEERPRVLVLQVTSRVRVTYAPDWDLYDAAVAIAEGGVA